MGIFNMKKIKVTKAAESVALDQSRTVNFKPGIFTVTDEIAEAAVRAKVATLIEKDK